MTATPIKSCRGHHATLIFSCWALALLIPLAHASKELHSTRQPGYVDAVELKLKCRELADQMLAKQFRMMMR